MTYTTSHTHGIVGVPDADGAIRQGEECKHTPAIPTRAHSRSTALGEATA